MLPSLLALAVGLAMDAVAVAAARGLAAPSLHRRDVLRLAVLFGAFQALMPALGIFLGQGASRFVDAYAHWIAFVLLTFLGARMIRESRSTPDASTTSPAFTYAALLPLALATSIDAFAAGIPLPLLGWPIVPSLVTIGLTTFVLSYAGAYLGRRLGPRLGPRLDLLGGLILVGIGVKILVEHMTSPW